MLKTSRGRTKELSCYYFLYSLSTLYSGRPYILLESIIFLSLDTPCSSSNHASLGTTVGQGRFLAGSGHDGGRLGAGDGVDQQTHSALGNDIRDRVSELNGDDGTGSGDTNHGEDVDNGVSVVERKKKEERRRNHIGVSEPAILLVMIIPPVPSFYVRAPRNDGGELGPDNESPDLGVRFGVGGVLESHQEGVDNVDKGNHGGGPPEPTRAQLRCIQDDFSGISEDNHECRGGSEGDGFGACFVGVEFHDENDFNEQEGDGQEPIHVTVGVIKGDTGSRERSIRVPFVGFDPGVEDSEIVIGGNEGDQSSNDQGALVALGDASLVI